MQEISKDDTEIKVGMVYGHKLKYDTISDVDTFIFICYLYHTQT